MTRADQALGRHRVFVYSRCSTCRKALQWLKERHIPHVTLDITSDPPDSELLREAMVQLAGRSRLFNTSGASYRSLGATTVKAMSDVQALAALAADGKLIKRPLLVTADGRITTGFRLEEWEALLGSDPAPSAGRVPRSVP